MIIYSIIPLEQIVEGIENQDHSAIEEVNIHGTVMQIQAINAHQARIVRLISPNPQDYLNPAYKPGELIHFHIQ